MKNLLHHYIPNRIEIKSRFLADNQWTLAEFLGEEPVIRISNMSNPAMILQRLENVFGGSAHFTIEVAQEMQKHMLEDLNNEVKEEYMSTAGLAMLYDRAGGKLNEKMMEIIITVSVYSNNPLSPYMYPLQISPCKNQPTLPYPRLLLSPQKI